ncbi:MAG: glycoside hydrolase family 3 C-terminal domain-containing protein [Clostridia bacterium]|nr:glycoside hydrolase family 3 C-terminal domain-containing protein [Clostridia bacterium]
MKILGIPEIKSGDMKDYCRNLFPNSTALSHAFDRNVWHDVSMQKSKQMLEDNVNFVLTNGPKIKISPYRREISEDAFLASEMSTSMLKGANDAGAVAGALGMYLTEADTDWMDIAPDERVINEALVYPYLKTVTKNKNSCLVMDLRSIKSDYQTVSYSAIKTSLDKVRFKVCKKATDENTVKFITNGIICLEGSKNALEASIARYKKLMRSIENNEGATIEQLNDEIEKLTAISTETVDSSLDVLIDFIYTCAQYKQSASKPIGSLDETAYVSTVKSSVLLKNKNSLPLNKKARIAVIGDIFYSQIDGEAHVEKFCNGLTSKGYKCIGHARGYSMETPYANEYLTEAMNLAGRADTVIVFLGLGYEQEKLAHKTKSLTLPANQLYLIKNLLGYGKNVIAVISSGLTVDVEFSRSVSALIYAPLEVKYSAEALLGLMTGENDFEGRLAYTLYSGTDVAFAKRNYYKHKQNVKSGVFIGYKYYDTAGLTLGYPFGYGLSYAKFKYSNLTATSTEVSVWVENVSACAGTETVQVYAGIENSKVVRPKKELCGFKKVYLLPGEKKKVLINYELPKIYTENQFVVESGTYVISVGSAVDNIHLTTSYNKKGLSVKRDGKNLANYLQSVSNVVLDNYTLEAKYSVMKMSIRNILFGILFVLIAISLAVFNSTIKTPSMFVSIVAGVMSVISVMFFVSEVIERNKEYKEERKKIDEANKDNFKDAQELPFLSSDAIFEEEFVVEDEDEKVDDVVVETVSEGDMLEFVNKDFKFINAVDDLKLFFLTRGYKLNGATAENLIASLATSKLLLTQGVPYEDFNKIIALLAEYLGTDAFVDVHGEHENSTSFYSIDYHGDHTKKNLLLALEYARDNPNKLVVASLEGADVNALEDYVQSFYKYLNYAKSNNKIVIKLENGSTATYNITNNFRLFVNVDNQTSIDALPENIVRISTVNYLDYTVTHIGELPSSHFEFNKYQLDYILEKEGKDANLQENSWKKIDRLVKFTTNYAPFKIANKSWILLEKHIALLMSAGLSVDEILDVSVGSKIIPSMSIVLKDKIDEGDKSFSEYVEFALGEQKADYSKKLLKNLTVNPNKVQYQQNEETISKQLEEPVEENEVLEQAVEQVQEEITAVETTTETVNE